MKKLMKKLEDIMVAVTFAEAGEYDEANRLAGNSTHEKSVKASTDFEKTAIENARK